MKKLILELPYSLWFSKPKGARTAHAPPKYCHAPPVGMTGLKALKFF